MFLPFSSLPVQRREPERAVTPPYVLCRDATRSGSRHCTILLLILLFAIFPASPVAAQSAETQVKPLSARERTEIFNRVWHLIKDRYYDPAFNGVDWQATGKRYQPLAEAAASDEAFYGLLERMVGELRDAHTHVRTPLQKRLRDKSQAISTGIYPGEVEGQTVVVGVDPASAPARSGVQPGMTLLAIDGKPAAARLGAARAQVGASSSERAARLLAYGHLLYGSPETTIALTMAWPDVATSQTTSAPLSVTALRRVVRDEAQVLARKLPSGFGYIQLTRWRSPATELFRAELEKLRDAPGLIIDLRGNGGGEVGVVLEIGNYFFANKVSFGRFIRRSGKAVELSAGGSQLYGGPVVILVNEASASGSELFSGAMQEAGRAIVIGQQTCGCLLAAGKEKLPGGGELTLSIFGYLSPRGRRLEGDGVIPDRVVPLRLSDLRQRRDPALAEAEKVLKEWKSAQPKAAPTSQ